VAALQISELPQSARLPSLPLTHYNINKTNCNMEDAIVSTLILSVSAKFFKDNKYASESNDN
jgi:hypothetical protein